MTTTTYDVMLRYRMHDEASRKMKSFGREAQSAAKGVDGLSLGIGKLLAIGAGAVGLGALKKTVVDYNSEMEQAKIVTAGLLQGFQGGEFNDRMKEANVLVGELQQKAKSSTATTEELVGFLRDTIGPLSQAGLKTKEMAEFTTSAVVAAKAMNYEGTAALDIQQALNSQVGTRDKFAKALIESMGMQVDKFNQLNRAQRLSTLQLSLRQKFIREMGKAQETSFSGQVSTLKDNFQIWLAGAGQKLFQSITAEIKQWNEWIAANQGRLEQWAIDFSQALKKGFEYAKGVGSFLVEHKDLLIALAKGFLIGKAVGGTFGWLKDAHGAFTSLASGASSAALQLNAAAFAAGALVTALEYTIEKLEKRQERNMQQQADFNSVRTMLYKAAGGDKGAARSLLGKGGMMEQSGLMGSDGHLAGYYGKDSWQRKGGMQSFSYGKTWDAIGQNMDFPGIDTTGDVMGEAEKMDAALQKALEVNRVAEAQMRAKEQRLHEINLGKSLAFYTWQYLANKTTEDGLNVLRRYGLLKDQNATDVKVTINRIEAKSEDPDRFIFLLEAGLEDLSRTGSASRFSGILGGA